MRTFQAIGLVLLGVIVGAGVFQMRDTVLAQGQRDSGRLTLTDVEWNGGLAFRFITDSRTRKCYMAALDARAGHITAMVEAPAACQ